jgi:hypothetical protein
LPDYPALSKVSFEYDGSKTRIEQAEEVLKPITSELEQSIIAAEKAREARSNELRQEAEELAAAQKREEEARRLEAEERAAAQMREKEARRRETEERATAQRREEEQHRKAEERAAEEEERRWEVEERAVSKKREDELRLKLLDVEKRKSDPLRWEKPSFLFKTTLEDPAPLQKKSTDEPRQSHNPNSQAAANTRPNNPKPRRRKGAEFFFPNIQGDVSEEETPAHPTRLLPAFARTTNNDLPSTQGTSTTQNTDKRVRWDDHLEEDDNRDESDFADEISSEDEEEDAPPRKHSDSRKTYSMSMRGLKAISSNSKMEIKSSAKMDGRTSAFSASQMYVEGESGGVLELNTMSMRGHSSYTSDEEQAVAVQQKVEDKPKRSSNYGILDISSDEEEQNEAPKRSDKGNRRIKSETGTSRVWSPNLSSDEEEEPVAPQTGDYKRSKSSASKASEKNHHQSPEHSQSKEKPKECKADTRFQSTSTTKDRPSKSVGKSSGQRRIVADDMGIDKRSTKLREKTTTSDDVSRETDAEQPVVTARRPEQNRGVSIKDFSARTQAARKSRADEPGSNTSSKKNKIKTGHAKVSQQESPPADARGSSQMTRKRTYGGNNDLSAGRPKGSTSTEQTMKKPSTASSKHGYHKTIEMTEETSTASLGNRQSRSSHPKISEAKRQDATRSTDSDKLIGPSKSGQSGGSKKRRLSGEAKEDKKRRKGGGTTTGTGKVQLDSLATRGRKRSASSADGSNRTSSTKATGGSTGAGQARRSKKESSRSRARDKNDIASRKRSASDISNTKTSGLSSSEVATKQRRRKKKEMPISRKKSVKSVTDGAYNFSF